MKPKSEYQKRIVALSKSLPAVTERQIEYANQHCHSFIAFGLKRKKWCSHCGKKFEIPQDSVERSTITCPHCLKRLKNQHSRKTVLKEREYYTIITTYNKFQICRHYVVDRTIRKGGKIYFDINEVVQNWIDENGKETIIARPTFAFSSYYDQWLIYKEMELKKVFNLRYRNYSKYDIVSDIVYPHINLLPNIKRNGFTRRITGFPINRLICYLLKDKEAEMLVKNKQYYLMKYKWQHNISEYRMPHQHSIRIANRHKYIVKDASLWNDYLDLLDYFRVDTHNPYYVCIDNVRVEYNRLLEKKNEIERKLNLEKDEKEAARFESEYKKEKGKYFGVCFGVCFGNSDIVITVIKSVNEIAEEGDAMHHCVYRNSYFKKPFSLILSAKDKYGNRLETIEVNLQTFEVVQSRGVCNQNTPQHDTIIQLVKNNIQLIRNVA